MNGSIDRTLAGKALTASAVAAVIVILLVVLWQAANILLLLFAGVLLAVFFCRLASMLQRRTRLPYGWSLLVVVVVLVGVIGLIVWLRASTIAQQADELMRELPRALDEVKVSLQQHGLGRRVMEELSRRESVPSDLLSHATGLFSTTLGFLFNLLILLFIGIYLAAQPRVYRNGFVQLWPPLERRRALEILDSLGETLWWWLVARFCAMVLVGVLVTLGLWLLDLPLAFTLGVIAALLGFVPNIGPIVAAVPAVLLALLQSPQKAVYVAILYLAIQILEGYIITPILQQKAVHLPPAFVIAAQLILGVLAGAMGLALATPLAASILVLVQKIYIEGWLGDTRKGSDCGSTGGHRMNSLCECSRPIPVVNHLKT